MGPLVEWVCGCLVVVVVVVEDGGEPLLHLLERHVLARRIVRHLHTHP